MMACGGELTQIDYQEIPAKKPLNNYAPLYIDEVKIDIPNDDIGIRSDGARGCSWPYQGVQKESLSRAQEVSSLEDIFYRRLKAQGFILSKKDNKTHDKLLPTSHSASRFVIKARIISARAELCDEKAAHVFYLFSSRSGITGQMLLTVEWALYDLLKSKSVRHMTTQGYSHLRYPHENGISRLLSDSFAMATHNLGTMRAFRDIISVPQNYIVKQNHEEITEKLYGAQGAQQEIRHEEDVIINTMNLWHGHINDNMSAIQNAMLSLYRRSSEYEGVVISKDGHVLVKTGDLKAPVTLNVKVEGSSDRKPVAILLRKTRDYKLALYKIQNAFAHFVPDPIPVREDMPRVSGDVYKIEDPFPKELNAKIHKGLVSSHIQQKEYGTKKGNDKAMLSQIDISESSYIKTSPLLDKSGNILAFKSSDVSNDYFSSISGLTLYVPIAELFRQMGIRITRSQESLNPATEVKESNRTLSRKKYYSPVFPKHRNANFLEAKGMKIFTHEFYSLNQSQNRGQKLFYDLSLKLDDRSIKPSIPLEQAFSKKRAFAE